MECPGMEFSGHLKHFRHLAPFLFHPQPDLMNIRNLLFQNRMFWNVGYIRVTIIFRHLEHLEIRHVFPFSPISRDPLYSMNWTDLVRDGLFGGGFVCI